MPCPQCKLFLLFKGEVGYAGGDLDQATETLE